MLSCKCVEDTMKNFTALLEHSYLNEQNEHVVFCNACGLSPTTSEHSIYFYYNLTLIGALLPLMAIIGAFCNILSLMAFCQKRLRKKSGNVYLGALAVSDFFLVTTSIFMFTFEAVRQKVRVINEVYLHTIEVIFPLGTIAQTTSVYITVMAGIDGFVATCMGRLTCSKSYTTPKTAVRTCIGVLAFAIGYNMPHFFEVDVVQCYEPFVKVTKREPCATPLRQDPVYLEVYYMYMYTIVMVVGPLVILIVLSGFIITFTVLKHRPPRKRADVRSHSYAGVENRPERVPKLSHIPLTPRPADGRTVPRMEVRKGGFTSEPANSFSGEQKFGLSVSGASDNFLPSFTPPLNPQAADGVNNSMTNAVTENHSIQPDTVLSTKPSAGAATRDQRQTIDLAKPRPQETSDQDDDPITLIMVVVLFIICNALGLLVNFLEAFMDFSQLSFPLLNFLVDGSNFLVVFNSSVNFFIYMTFDVKFRAILKMNVVPRLTCQKLRKGNAHVAEKLSAHGAAPPTDSGDFSTYAGARKSTEHREALLSSLL